MRGFEGRRKQQPKVPEEEAGIADFFPPPKERLDEKGEVIPFIKPMRREMLRQEVQKRIDQGKSFHAAFDDAFNNSTYWKDGLDPELRGAYAQAIHDLYGEDYRPQDEWFHRDIAPNVAEERGLIDSEHAPAEDAPPPTKEEE